MATRTRRPRRAFGSLRRLPSGRHQAQYTGPDGLRHKAESTFLERGDAERWLREEEILIDRGEWTPPAMRPTYQQADPLTVAEYVAMVIERRATRSRKPLRPSTVALYVKLGRLCITPHVGHLPLAHLSPERVQRWHDDDMGADSPTQRANAYQLLRSALADAVEEGLLERNPCRIKGAGKPTPKRPGAAFSVDELVAYLQAVSHARFRAALAIAAWGSLRSGEVRALRRCDVSDDGTTVSVSRTLSRVHVKGEPPVWVIGPPKTTAGERVVTLPAIAAAEVAAYLREWDERHRDPKRLLWTARSGDPLHDSTLRGAHRRAAEAVGRPDLTLHDLRRTGATLAAQSGATTKEIMRRLGHTQPQVAMLYQVADDERDAAVARRMGDLSRPRKKRRKKAKRASGAAD